MMDKTYTASVVGAGSGGRLSLNALAASGRYSLVAACDLRPDACREIATIYPGIRTFSSHKEMFAKCPTDVVCVSTWAPSHREITLDALEGPLKGILVEKPLGDTAEAGAEILARIRARQLPAVVPHNMIVNGCGKDIIALFNQGAIGELRLVEIESDKWDIINAGIHWMNFFVTLCRDDPVDRVLAACDVSTRTYRDGMQVETEAVTYVVTKNGVRCIQHTGDDIPVMDHGRGALFRIIGTQGSIVYSNAKPGYTLLNRDHPEGVFLTPAAETGDKHQIFLEKLAKEIDLGVTDYAVMESSLDALRICEAAYLSNRHRCAVRFPLETFRAPASPPDWDPGKPYGGTGGGRDGRKLS